MRFLPCLFGLFGPFALRVCLEMLWDFWRHGSFPTHVIGHSCKGWRGRHWRRSNFTVVDIQTWQIWTSMECFSRFVVLLTAMSSILPSLSEWLKWQEMTRNGKAWQEGLLGLVTSLHGQVFWISPIATVPHGGTSYSLPVWWYQGHDVYRDMVASTRIGPWLEKMDAAVAQPARSAWRWGRLRSEKLAPQLLHGKSSMNCS